MQLLKMTLLIATVVSTLSFTSCRQQTKSNTSAAIESNDVVANEKCKIRDEILTKKLQLVFLTATESDTSLKDTVAALKLLGLKQADWIYQSQNILYVDFILGTKNIGMIVPIEDLDKVTKDIDSSNDKSENVLPINVGKFFITPNSAAPC